MLTGKRHNITREAKMHISNFIAFNKTQTKLVIVDVMVIVKLKY